MTKVNSVQLLNAAHAQRENILGLLEKLVKIETPSFDPDAQIEIKKVIDQELKYVDYEARWLSGTKYGGNIYARPNSRKKHVQTQLLLGHLDTVWPIGTLAKMPFLINQNTVKGPGVFDMKGGIVHLLIVLRILKELDYLPSVMPLVFLNSDEEIGSRESSRNICRLAKISSRSLVMEPALGDAGALKTRRKGVGRFTVHVQGKAAHAGLDPTAGASAILELSHVIQKLFALNDHDKGISVNVGIVDGGIRPNVVAPVSTATVDVRVLDSEDVPRIENAICSIESQTQGVLVSIDGQIGRLALEKNERNNLLWTYAKGCADELGIELSEGTAGGGSDGSTTSQFTATLDGLGAVGDGAHADHEFLYIDKSIERIALLAMIIMAPPLSVEQA